MIALFFDTETTGFPSEKNPPEIIQLAAVLQDTETRFELAVLSLIIKTTKPSHPGALALHGITQELSEKHGIEPLVADNMLALLASQADLIVAHNISFDVPMVTKTWSVAGPIMETKQQYCTMRNCSPYSEIPRRHASRSEHAKLEDAYRYFFDEEHDGAHNAIVDVRACQRLFHRLQEDEPVALV